MKSSIVKKVFFSIMIILVVTLGLQLIFQMFFAADVYLFFKQIEVERAFEQAIEDNGHNYDLMTNELHDSSNMPMLVLDEKQVIVNENFFDQLSYVVIETKQGSYKVMLGERVNELGELGDGYHHLHIGNEVSFVGALLKENNVIILDANVSNPLFESLVTVEGEIVDTHFIEKEAGVLSYQPGKLIRETGFLIQEGELHANNIEFVESETGLIINLIIRKIDNHYGVTLYTIDDLSNTFSVLNNFYIYFFIFQVVLLIGVSAVYTRWFTNPLQVLNKEAKAIANLDFEQKSHIETGDELEELSESLNSIADNMESNIERLKADAKEKAESETKMRELLANLSHEFKTPLGIMSGFLEMLESDNENKEYYIDTINGEINKLNELTKETLLLCESENYGSFITNKIVNLETLCDVSKFLKQIEDKSQILVTDVPNINVFCDANKIKTVIDNFMSNAIKYSDDGEAISLYVEDVGDSKVRIHVKNTGVTINEDEMDKIWSKYYRLEKSRNKDFGGNGIGLAITKNILDGHHSLYGAYNEKNSVVFYFELKKA